MTTPSAPLAFVGTSFQDAAPACSCDPEGTTLPLELHGVWDNWGIVFDPIPFQCSDGKDRIRCWASLDALAALCADEDLTGLDDPELAERFTEHIRSFVAVASFKYDAGAIERDGSVFVRPHDVARLARG